MSYAERNLEIARVNFQTAIKEIYAIEDDKEIKPAMEPQEYEVGEKPERFDFKNNYFSCLLTKKPPITINRKPAIKFKVKVSSKKNMTKGNQSKVLNNYFDLQKLPT